MILSHLTQSNPLPSQSPDSYLLLTLLLPPQTLSHLPFITITALCTSAFDDVVANGRFEFLLEVNNGSLANFSLFPTSQERTRKCKGRASNAMIKLQQVQLIAHSRSLTPSGVPSLSPSFEFPSSHHSGPNSSLPLFHSHSASSHRHRRYLLVR